MDKDTNTPVIEAWSDDAGNTVNERDTDDEYMFDPELLNSLDLGSSEAKFSPQLTIDNPGEGLLLRPLRLGDNQRGFLELLGQLTKVGDISEEQWQQRFRQMKSKAGTYHVMVIEDVTTHR